MSARYIQTTQMSRAPFSFPRRRKCADRADQPLCRLTQSGELSMKTTGNNPIGGESVDNGRETPENQAAPANRRQFIKRALAATSGLAAAQVVPSILLAPSEST